MKKRIVLKSKEREKGYVESKPRSRGKKSKKGFTKTITKLPMAFNKTIKKKK